MNTGVVCVHTEIQARVSCVQEHSDRRDPGRSVCVSTLGPAGKGQHQLRLLRRHPCGGGGGRDPVPHPSTVLLWEVGPKERARSAGKALFRKTQILLVPACCAPLEDWL